IRIYPNPASTNLFIENLSEGIRSITIFNSYGQQIFTSENLNQNTAINVESWPTGQYVVWINQTPTQLINVVH
ncbi:MAG: T9SS type A sorting domain-containing protein, partial [Schleiferiaceae bacterium]